MRIEQLKAKIYEAGTFNGWKGYIGLYLTQKELRLIRKAGIDYENMTMKQVFERL